MRVTGKLLFAGAGFAADQNRHLPLSRYLGLLDDAGDCRIGGDERRGSKSRRRGFGLGDRAEHWREVRMFDRSDKTAADFVPQSLAFPKPPFVQKRMKLSTENVVEIAAWGNRQAIQQHARCMIGCEYAARLVDRDQSCGQRMQVLAAIVEGDQNIAAMALAKKSVFDLRCGHANKRGGVGLA